MTQRSASRRSRGAEPAIAGVAGGGVMIVAALERRLSPRRFRHPNEQALRSGKAPVVVVPGTPPIYRYDEARAESQVARLAVDAALQRAAGRADVFVPVRQPIEAVGSRYIDWLVPGLLGMNIMGTGMWGVGFAIVNARSKRLLKRLVATPMSKAHYLLALILSRLATLAIEVMVIIGFAWAFFGVAVHGALWALAALAVIGALTFAAFGLFVASRARTIEALSGLMNLMMLPMWVLSGVFFASTNFPDAMQPVIRALPLTALNDALRIIVNEGRSIDAVAPQLAVLAVWGGVSFLLSLKLFAG